ncbi:uncharacterized protein MONBRDRAFT_8168 [Monosiga brevicollis MX1]|uniref:Inosine/uridine-preferring nucleoside hydrolase domain-containing protein n=1 Tax=Monosiga brevicollis TaxID=81824 RepID=A9UZ86_MONBE|nr:uncharacterized protein MONBRDRAFT_8168 [Monosiga brevicollis MX1]EDQ89191.1 predicted protein [Monosiga brevicollis MX1]|eukprot:XP_001745767.1 hypothetical protein [Monosiga brevicollis MX1]
MASGSKGEWSAVAATLARGQNGQKRKFIIDCDAGVDDAEALMVMLSSSIDVIGITCVSGNVACPQVVKNVQRVLANCKRSDIPIFAGAEAPLLATRKDATYFHGKDGLGDVPVDPSFEPDQASYRAPETESAVSALLRLAKEHVVSPAEPGQSFGDRAKTIKLQLEPLEARLAEAVKAGELARALFLEREVYAVSARLQAVEDVIVEFGAEAGPGLDILALGPLTNLAVAPRLYHRFPALVRHLIIMGGTSRARGNVPGFPSAEFNLFADPHSAQITLHSYFQPILVTWECCMDHSFEWHRVNEWLRKDTAKAKFIRHIFHFAQQVSLENNWDYIACDPLAAAVAVEPREVVPEDKMAQLHHCQVQTASIADPAYAQTVVDYDNLSGCVPNTWLIHAVHVPAVEKIFLRKMEDA